MRSEWAQFRSNRCAIRLNCIRIGKNILMCLHSLPIPYHYQYPDSMSICQSWTNPSILEQSWTNLMPILCRSHANLIILDQFINQLPIRQFNPNPPPIDQSWNNPMPICQSQSDANLTTGTNPTQNRSTSQIPITIQSANPLPIHKFITNPAIH